MKKKSLVLFFTVLFLGTVAAANVWYQVSVMDIVSFDEARHGISAFEMMETGNYLVNTFQGQVDYYNLKPPLAFLTMLAGYATLGANTLGLRFFSGAATLCTFLIVFLVSKRRWGALSAVLSLAVIMTTRTFIAHHNARSGDTDALFILFFTASACLLLNDHNSLRRYCMACLLAALAFLTKSFHAGPLCAIIALFYLMEKGLSFRSLLQGLVPLMFFLAPILLWGVMRYQYDGMTFFKHMVSYDAMERLSGAVEGHDGKASFTVSFIITDFKPWLQAAAVAAIVALFPPRGRTTGSFMSRTLFIKLCIIILVPILLYTVSATKLRWYAFCVYPFIAMLLGYFFTWLLQKKRTHRAAFALLCILPITAFVFSEIKTVNIIQKRRERFHDPLQHAMKEVSKGHPDSVALFLENGSWEQSHILAAKYAGNLILHEGNKAAYEAFAGVKVILEKTEIRD